MDTTTDPQKPAVPAEAGPGAPRMTILLHHPLERAYAIEGWAAERGFRITQLMSGRDGAFPAPDSYDWLVVMGGTMGVYEQDEHPWIPSELAAIRSGIEAGRTVIGVCLGAQMIAGALGAKVYPHTRREFGFFPIRLQAAGRESGPLRGWPEEALVMHWHGDTFDLPPGARLLASSDGCAHQAFAWGERVLALQFHPEFSAADLRAAMDGWTPWPADRFVQPVEDVLARGDESAPAMNRLLRESLDALLGQA